MRISGKHINVAERDPAFPQALPKVTKLCISCTTITEVQLVQWDMTYGLKLCSSHFSIDLKVIVHVSPYEV
jgi:hypothetical protein